MLHVSVIIPTYNRALLVQKAINSVIRQTYPNWELIIVDDGSDDETEEIIATEYIIDNRIKYFKKYNTGGAHSRNFGVNMATGPIITFLDSDDTAEEKWLETIVNNFQDDDVKVVCCGVTKKRINNEIISLIKPYSLGTSFMKYEGLFLSGAYSLYKEMFEKIGGFNINLKAAHHTELALKLTQLLHKNNYKIKSIDSCLINVYIHKGARIRYNHLSVYEGTRDLLLLHEDVIKLEANRYKSYLRVIVYNGLKAGRLKETKYFLTRLVISSPLNIKSWGYCGIYLYKSILNKIVKMENKKLKNE